MADKYVLIIDGKEYPAVGLSIETPRMQITEGMMNAFNKYTAEIEITHVRMFYPFKPFGKGKQRDPDWRKSKRASNRMKAQDRKANRKLGRRK